MLGSFESKGKPLNPGSASQTLTLAMVHKALPSILGHNSKQNPHFPFIPEPYELVLHSNGEIKNIEPSSPGFNENKFWPTFYKL